MSDKKEKRGIYNVTFNDKKATPINLDIEMVEDAVINEIIMYIKGWHNIRRDKGMGANHLKLHLEKGSIGEITIEELLNLGNSLRNYLKIFKEPYINVENNATARNYEWENENGIRFRVIIDSVKGEGHLPPLSPSDNAIITFYSDRNLNEKMEFKNKEVEEYYSKNREDKSLSEVKKEVEELKNLSDDFDSIMSSNDDTNKETQSKSSTQKQR